MSKPKHTAGPWSSSAWGEAAKNIIVAHDGDGNELPVVAVLDTGLSPEAVAANRRLVKAAPLLWDACVAAHGYLGGEGDDTSDPALAAVRRAVREAVDHVGIPDSDLQGRMNTDREGADE